LVVEDVVDEENEAFFIVENEKDTDLFGNATNKHEVYKRLQACGKPNFVNTILVSILILIQIPTNRIVRIFLVRLQNFYPCSSTNPLIAEMRK
jgi:hypothetical protein